MGAAVSLPRFGYGISRKNEEAVKSPSSQNLYQNKVGNSLPKQKAMPVLAGNKSYGFIYSLFVFLTYGSSAIQFSLSEAMLITIVPCRRAALTYCAAPPHSCVIKETT